jgi:SOS-response transcriptional repressor LexA
MRPKNPQTRPTGKPLPIRFSENQLSEIESVAQEFNMSRAEIIRLACSAGLVALKKLNPEGLAKAVANVLIESHPNHLQPASRYPEAVEKIHPEADNSPKSTYGVSVVGNIAAGSLQPGDTIPYSIQTSRPLGKNEYVLRVEGKSMEPVIMDGSLVIMRRHTVPPVPKAGTIVEYYDERGVTLKKLARRKNKETGKMEYVLHPLNPAFGDIEPMDGGRVSAVFVDVLTDYRRE